MGCPGAAHPDLLGPPRNHTSALSSLLSSPAGSAGPPSGPGAVCVSTSPFSGPAGLLLLMSTLLMPSQPFTTQTPRADISLTSAPCCWQHGAPALPDLTRMDRGTFLTQQRPFSTQPPGRAPGQGVGCTYKPSMGQGSPTHTMVCVLPLLDTDIIYCISFVNTERMWCNLFSPFVCSSSPKAKLRFLFPDLDVPHQQGAMCLCLTWGRAFPHHNWGKREPRQLPKSSSCT